MNQAVPKSVLCERANRERSPMRQCGGSHMNRINFTLFMAGLAALLPSCGTEPAPPSATGPVSHSYYPQPERPQPPANQPPANQPPANQPLANQPSANQPPAEPDWPRFIVSGNTTN